MAKIRKVTLKSGKTVYRSTVYVGINPATGKPKYKQITEESYKKAEITVNRLTVDRNEGRTIKKDDITFYTACKEWLSSYKNTVKPSTLKSVKSVIEIILPYFSYYKVSKITHKICQNMINDLIENRKLKASSALNCKIYASLVFKYCLKQEYISKNPMQYVEIPKIKDDFLYSEKDKGIERKYWLKEEVLTFLELAKKELEFHDFLMFRILLFTGIRKGELHALHWSDINFSTGEMLIMKTLALSDGKYILQKTKTASSNRSVILDEITLLLLKEWRHMLRDEYFAFGNRNLWEQNPPVFSYPNGQYFALPHLNNVMNNNFYKNHPEFHKITIHQMRHTHASLLFESGASLKDVQAKLGHSSMDTTMNIYTHVTETKAKKTMDNFAKFMEF